MHPPSKRLTSPAILLALGLGACATPVQPYVAASPYPVPPPPRNESIPPPPVNPQPMIWQPGHWDWTGSSYAWSDGLWVSREGHGDNWLDGYWTHGTGVWTWVPAHWV